MLVSTVIPTYNRAKDVVHAVDSALAQTHREQEIFVIDDGSKDDTEQVLARYADRITYVKVPNGGVSAARNHGMSLAKGDAIAFLDSDDTWMPSKLEKQVEVLETRPEIDYVICSYVEVDEDGGNPTPFNRRATMPEDGWVLEHVLRNPSLTPSSLMVRMPVMRAVGGFDPTLRTAEDLDLHLKLSIAGHQLVVLEEPLLYYLRGNAGLSGSVRTYMDYVRVMEGFMARHGDEIAASSRHAAMFGCYKRNAHGLLAHGKFSGAAKLMLKALRNARRPSDAVGLGQLGVHLGRVVGYRVVKRLRPS